MLTHVGTMKIETERLILRKFEYKDNESVLEYWAADEKVQLIYASSVYKTIEEVNGLLNKYINNYENNEYYRWAIILKETGECIGQIAYFGVNNNYHFAEIEYCIGQSLQNKGYATEATKAVTKFGLDKINLHKVQICHNSINMKSRRVIEKCGFTYEGTLRDFFYENGKYLDRVYYSILEDEVI